MYSQGLEIGNLVNPLGHSTDVGFGLERLYMIYENKERVDKTSLFNNNIHPILSDHCRTMDIFWQNNIIPGNKGRNYICRKILRRIIKLIKNEKFIFQEWIESERILLNKQTSLVKKMWNKYKDKPKEFWWNTYGISFDDINH